MFSFTDSEWVEASFKKRECGKVIASAKYGNRCYCGLAISSHVYADTPIETKPSSNFGEKGKEKNVEENGKEIRSSNGISLDQHAKTSGSPSSSGCNNGNNSQEHWNPFKHTIAFPTDAYGCIDFRGTHTNKAQYIRLSHDTKPELVLTLLLREWCLEKPKLLITVTGGKANFDLQPRIKWCLRKGLLKAAKTTGAWILTGGTNTGVHKHVGDALVSEKSPRIKGGRVVSIGIAPWGVVEKRNELIGKNKDVPFHTVAQPRSRFAALNKHHAYFLLVDNGTVGKYGAEIALRRKLEKFISHQSLSGSSKSHFSTPLVCLVIEGGTNTIRAVLEYVTASPPVPVVVCDGTGRAADLIAFVHKYASDDGDLGAIEDMKEQIIHTIKKTFDVSSDMAAKLYLELRQCIKRRHLITIFRCSGDRGEKPAMLDEVILTALFKAQHLHPLEQLTLALTWNRCDIARKEIFTYGQDWPPGALEFAMQEALELDRVDFVRLLLEHGIDMNKFMTVKRLESLYNSRRGPANTLEYIVRDVVPRMPRGYQYTLADIGLVINQLMGTGYTASYTEKKYKLQKTIAGPTENSESHPEKNIADEGAKDRQYNISPSVTFAGLQKTDKVMKHLSINRMNGTCDKAPEERKLIPKNLKKSISSHTKISLMSPKHVISNEDEYYSQTFEYPFSDLIVWAVLTKRQEMAKLMWQHGEQNLAKALAASRLYQAMALEAADDDLDVEIFDELTNYSNVFEQFALQLLEYCYQSDDDLTQYMLTASLDNWSRNTCLKLAVTANHLQFLAHPLSQAILADLWMGGLRMRKNPGFKIILGLLIPVTILQLDFKTREELELMPQTEEELHGRDDRESSSSSTSSSSSSSRRSSINRNDLDSLSSVEMGTGLTGKLLGRKRVEAACSRLDSKPEAVSHANEHNVNSTRVASRKMSNTSENLDLDVPTFYQSENFFDSNLLSKNDSAIKKKTRPLKWKKKLYEFYAAPITKYYSHLFAYSIFLTAYTYICLVKTPHNPSVMEWYVAACMSNFFLEKIRQIVAAEPANILKKMKVFACESNWNIIDVIAIISFLVAFALRLVDISLIKYCRVAYATLITYWYVRSLKLIGVNKYFGPYVMMIRKMIAHMFYFVVLLLVVLMAFGICRQAILFPNEEADWFLVRHIFYQPYFMLYGEVFAGDIDPICNATCTEYEQCGTNADGTLKVPCVPGHWITPIMMTVYLLVANILLLNLLIATFNTIYNKVNLIAQQYWHFQRFSVVMEYEEKPILPAPLTFISHIYRICKYIYRRCKGINPTFETGLKVNLSKYDMERLYDFEEECAEGLMQQKEDESLKKTDVRVKSVLDMMEDLRGKMEDFERWENINQECNHAMDFRLQKLEDVAQQTSSHLSVIHRFMAAQDSGGKGSNASGISDIDSENESKLERQLSSDDLEPIASCGSIDEHSSLASKYGQIGAEDDFAVPKDSNKHQNISTYSVAEPQPEDPMKNTDPIPISGLQKDLISCNKNNQSESEHDGEKVRFQIEEPSSLEAEKIFSLPDATLPVPSSLNRETSNITHSKQLPARADQKSKRKISKASCGKSEFRAKQNYVDANYGSIEKLRHISNESKCSIEVHGTPLTLPEEKQIQRRLRRYTESSTGARTSEDEVNLLYNHTVRRKASRMEHAMLGKVLGKQSRIGEENKPKKRLSQSKDSQEEDEKEKLTFGRQYFRSQSEISPALPPGTNMNFQKNSKNSHAEEELTDSSDSATELVKHRLAIFPISRKIHRKQRRDYTSITDQLEEMICVTPNPRSESKSPRPDIPAIEIEAKCLLDAEETDYNLMETLIEQRLRRDSTNLAASLEELVAKSIKDESSTSTSSSSTTSCSPEESDSEYSNSSKHNVDVAANENLVASPFQQNTKSKKTLRKHSVTAQRNITTLKPTTSNLVLSKKKHKNKRKQVGKKKIGSKISLASLEIVEPQPSNATIHCNPTGEPDKKKEEIDDQNQLQQHDVCKDVEIENTDSVHS